MLVYLFYLITNGIFGTADVVLIVFYCDITFMLPVLFLSDMILGRLQLSYRDLIKLMHVCKCSFHSVRCVNEEDKKGKKSNIKKNIASNYPIVVT